MIAYKPFFEGFYGISHALIMPSAIRSPELQVIGISCVVGNSDVDTVTDATLRVCEAAEAPLDLVIARGCEKPLQEPPHPCPEIHGHDSLGDLNPPLPPPVRRATEGHAVDHILRALESADDKVTIIALAPLTNIATAFMRSPDVFKRKCDRIVWMGGAVSCGGNATAWAEANAFYDPEAASIVLSSGLPITMYPWDVYLKVEVSYRDLHCMGLGSINVDQYQPSVAYGDLIPDGASRLCARLLHRDMKHWGMTSVMIGDAGAVAAFLMPERVTVKRMHVAVELSGEHTRGMTCCDQRPVVFPPDKPSGPLNVDVCVDADGARLAHLFAMRVLRPHAHSPYCHLKACQLRIESSSAEGSPGDLEEHSAQRAASNARVSRSVLFAAAAAALAFAALRSRAS